MRNGGVSNVVLVIILVGLFIRMCSLPNDNPDATAVHKETLAESYNKREALVANIVNIYMSGKSFDGYKFEDMEFKGSSDYLRHDYINQRFEVKREKLRKEHSYYQVDVELTNHTEINGETVDVMPEVVSVKSNYGMK